MVVILLKRQACSQTVIVGFVFIWTVRQPLLTATDLRVITEYFLELANNKFKKIPEALKSCMILIKLNLHNNFIRDFLPDLKNLCTLKELILRSELEPQQQGSY